MKTSGKSWSRYIDKSIKAKKSGWRKSKETGERYYEDRPDHSDSDPKSKYAKGGIFEHGLEIGDKITGRNGLNKVEGYNKEMRETFTTDLDKGKRISNRYAKGGAMAKGGKPVPTILTDAESEKIKAEIVKRTKEKLKQAKTPEEKEYAYKMAEYMGVYKSDLMAKGGKTKKGKKEPMVVRGYFDDEPYEYGSGGAIYVGDKVKIKGSNKSMVVKKIGKGKKGYVEFTGDAGTYLKGDLEKFANGGSIKVNLGSGEMDLEDAIKMYENKIKSQGRVTNERDENMLKQLKSMRPKMAKGGMMATGGNTDDDTPKIYVADLNAYNNGRLVGEWVDLSDFDNGEEVMQKLGEIVDEWKQKYGDDHEEWAIHDYENFSRSLYSEYMGEEDFDKVIQVYKVSRDKDIPANVLGDIMQNFDPDDLEEWIDEHYEGQFDSDTDLAYHYVDSLGGVEQLGEETLGRYFDYESFGRDLGYDYYDYDGHYFRSYAKGGTMGKSYDLKKYVFNTNWSYSIGGL